MVDVFMVSKSLIFCIVNTQNRLLISAPWEELQKVRFNDLKLFLCGQEAKIQRKIQLFRVRYDFPKHKYDSSDAASETVMVLFVSFLTVLFIYWVLAFITKSIKLWKFAEDKGAAQYVRLYITALLVILYGLLMAVEINVIRVRVRKYISRYVGLVQGALFLVDCNHPGIPK